VIEPIYKCYVFVYWHTDYSTTDTGSQPWFIGTDINFRKVELCL